MFYKFRVYSECLLKLFKVHIRIKQTKDLSPTLDISALGIRFKHEMCLIESNNVRGMAENLRFESSHWQTLIWKIIVFC